MKYVLFLIFILFSACTKNQKNIGKINLKEKNVSLIIHSSLEEEIKVNIELIESILDIDEFAPGYDPTIYMEEFFIIGEHEVPYNYFNGETASPIIKKIVARGYIIVPDLLKHISDDRKTKLIFKIPHTGFGETSYCEEYEYRDRSKKTDFLNGGTDAQEDIYNLTIGDFCFFALGQIVNRNYCPLRGQPTACHIINSPVKSINLRNKIIKDWSGLTLEEHKKLLLDDLNNSTGQDKIVTLNRILYYYPTLIEKVYYKK